MVSVKWLTVLALIVGLTIYSQPIFFENLLLTGFFHAEVARLTYVSPLAANHPFSVQVQAIDNLLSLLPLTVDEGFPESLRQQTRISRALNVFSSSETRVRPDLVSKDARSKSYPASWVDRFGVHSPITLPHILYLHGGGYVFGDSESYAGFVSKLIHGVSGGARGLIPNYALCPEHTPDDALEDAVAAYQHVLKAGAHARQIVIVGDSAGGNLAIMTMLALIERGIELPSGLVLLSPWTDLTLQSAAATGNDDTDRMIDLQQFTRMCERAFRGNDELVRRFSPALDEAHPADSFRKFPRTLVAYSRTELLANDARAIIGKLRKAGVQVNTIEESYVPHVWPIFNEFFPQAVDAIDSISGFILQTTGGRRK